MTYTVQELALQYAERLTAFHEAEQSDCCDKAKVVRRAYNEMCAAQNDLNEACRLAAQQEYA